MAYKVDHNVPLPRDVAQATAPKKPRKVLYPFRQMSEGDSFFVRTTAKNHSLIARRLYASAHHAKKVIPGANFITRSVTGGVRVWRVGNDPA